MWHASFISVTWHIRKWGIPHSHVSHDVFIIFFTEKSSEWSSSREHTLMTPGSFHIWMNFKHARMIWVSQFTYDVFIPGGRLRHWVRAHMYEWVTPHVWVTDLKYDELIPGDRPNRRVRAPALADVTSAYTHTHTHKHADIYTHANAPAHAYTHTHKHTHMRVRAHTHTHARTHARTHAHERMHAYMHAHTHTYTYSCRAGLFLEIQGSFNDIQGSFMMRRESTCVSGLMCVYQIRVTLCSSRAVLQLQCAVHNVYQNQQKSPRYPLQSSPSRALYIFNT